MKMEESNLKTMSRPLQWGCSDGESWDEKAVWFTKDPESSVTDTKPFDNKWISTAQLHPNRIQHQDKSSEGRTGEQFVEMKTFHSGVGETSVFYPMIGIFPGFGGNKWILYVYYRDGPWSSRGPQAKWNLLAL